MSPSQFITLPSLPAAHDAFIPYLASRPEAPMRTLVEPYNKYDAELRSIFAQQPSHSAISETHIVPVFDGHEEKVNIRARDLGSESDEEHERYIMPLAPEDRKPNGSPAIVQSLKEYQKNFAIFSESALSELDWSNVVVAGSAALTPLLPVPQEFTGSKRSLRRYYHEKVAPASDVDIFLYGMTEDQAKEKIQKIERHIRDSILSETTTVRTKNAITIVSEYPVRHVQIVLRIYRSISEMLAGFDVDCSCVAYDGTQVWASPRTLTACMTQINHIDLSRRSPSYENRLFKYARRGFEIHWDQLDRQRINPTIFERGFQSVVGLARLLVLEKLPEKQDRETYADQRRLERGRPRLNRYITERHTLRGDIKAEHEYEVADWICEDDVSDYHTFTIPYGPKYHARKIEKLLYKKDLLLNAEWNRPKDREVNLHRHPAFFGSAEDVMRDCCGYCPDPINSEEEEVAKEEAKRFVSGEIAFIKDDPGRQAIGSFNPITTTEWTEMAYVADTENLLIAIAEQDLGSVQSLLKHVGVNPNHRDWTGRTPLHLAATCSNVEIVQCLMDHGARIIARLADGKTALHLAALRGDAAIVSALLRQSEVNQEQEQARSSRAQGPQASQTATESDQPGGSQSFVVVSSDIDDEADRTTQHSYVNLKTTDSVPNDTLGDLEDNEPDIYDVNVCAWDVPATPLHLAIICGHTQVVELLVTEFGANVTLPVKLTGQDQSPRGSILPLVLASMLPASKAKAMLEVLLSLGASAAQADFRHVTALHYLSKKADLLEPLLALDKAGVSRALNHMPIFGNPSNATVATPLTSAILEGNHASALRLLDAGIRPHIDLASFMKAVQRKFNLQERQECVAESFQRNCKPPIILAVEAELPSLVLRLRSEGADLNSPVEWQEGYGSYARRCGQTVLDKVRSKILSFRQYFAGTNDPYEPPLLIEEAAKHLDSLEPGTYAHWLAQHCMEHAELYLATSREKHDKHKADQRKSRSASKDKAVQKMLDEYIALESQLASEGAKTFSELHLGDVQQSEPLPHGQALSKRPNRGSNVQWTPLPKFTTADSVGDREKAYLRLFQSCWTGDLDTIRGLTTKVWDQNNPPLKIAVYDRGGFSTFDIAVLRGHTQAAKLILAIASEQYAFKQQAQKERSTKKITEDFDGNVSSDDSDDDFHHDMATHDVDERFTIDDIGNVPAQAEGDHPPAKLLTGGCPAAYFVESLKPHIKKAKLVVQNLEHPMRYSHVHHEGNKTIRLPASLLQLAIFNDDSQLLSFLLDMGSLYSDTDFESTAEETTGTRHLHISQSDLEYAISLGRVDLLDRMIRRTGAGLPLETLFKPIQTEDEVLKKPKYYMGLSVRGKKREDWARAGRETRHRHLYNADPLLLVAARSGSLESVEWFLSDTPHGCFMEYILNNQANPRLRDLVKSKQHAGKAIADWLGTNRHILAHCAIMAPASSSLDVLRLVVQNDSSLIHRKSRSGLTPLHLAFSAYGWNNESQADANMEIIKFLIEAGSDQKTRDSSGSNIIHSLLSTVQSYPTQALQIRRLLGVLDQSIIQDLLMQKSNQSPGSVTPLALFLHQRGFLPNAEEIVAVMSSFSEGAELGIINGEGDTPLHTQTRHGRCRVVEQMLQIRPDLLWRENAVGRTPYEVAKDLCLAQLLSKPPQISGEGIYYNYQSRSMCKSILSRPPENFANPVAFDKTAKSAAEETWDVCARSGATGSFSGRKIVSLLEANEVAKRLAYEKRKQRKNHKEDEEADELGEDQQSETDQVDRWRRQ